MDITTANLIIYRLGGTTATARLCEVEPPSVSDWRKTGIPKARLKFLRLARPDVFQDLEEGQADSELPPTSKAHADPAAPCNLPDDSKVREAEGNLGRAPMNIGREMT